MEVLPLLLDYADWLVGAVAILGAAWLLVRKAKAKIASFAHKANAITETMLGRDEIVHPDTGRVLAEATPGLGFRLAHMEEAIVSLSVTHTAMTALTQRVDELTTVVTDHITTSETQSNLRVEEQTQMWKAIKAVAESAPATSDDH